MGLVWVGFVQSLGSARSGSWKRAGWLGSFIERQSGCQWPRILRHWLACACCSHFSRLVLLNFGKLVIRAESADLSDISLGIMML